LASTGLACRVIATEHTHPPSQTLSGFWQRLRRLTIGSPLDERTEFGPVTHRQHQLKLLGYFTQARAEHNTIIHGGTLLDRPGCYVEPTVILANSIN
ncbi:aldehyde dehydrogenase family protein, partial [Paraburkholderia sp. SIMBA_027]|uniref:aldehyde dehydrogenase family protein n=1 Tax=Paraburkholderia sp. SIMBA_027 TaxID=3085770 RepID=UPI003979DE7C